MLEKVESKRNQRNERGVSGSLNNKKEDTLSHMDKGKANSSPIIRSVLSVSS